MTKIKGKNILITGGATGIGKEMAKIVLVRGAGNLILWDIDEKKLKETEAEFKSLFPNVYTIVSDVSDAQNIIKAAEKTKELIGSIDILINNAGILIGKYFSNHTHADIDKVMNINASAYMHICLEFLPEMIQKNSGHICNIASAAGMIENPQMSVYCASKAAIIGWSGSLRLEMEKQKKNILLTVATPNFVKTDLASGVKSKVSILDKEKVAIKIIRGIERNKLFVRLPFSTYTIPFLRGVLPVRWFEFLMDKVFKIYNSMDSFTGTGKKVGMHQP